MCDLCCSSNVSVNVVTAPPAGPQKAFTTSPIIDKPLKNWISVI